MRKTEGGGGEISNFSKKLFLFARSLAETEGGRGDSRENHNILFRCTGNQVARSSGPRKRLQGTWLYSQNINNSLGVLIINIIVMLKSFLCGFSGDWKTNCLVEE